MTTPKLTVKQRAQVLGDRAAGQTGATTKHAKGAKASLAPP